MSTSPENLPKYIDILAAPFTPDHDTLHNIHWAGLSGEDAVIARFALVKANRLRQSTGSEAVAEAYLAGIADARAAYATRTLLNSLIQNDSNEDPLR